MGYVSFWEGRHQPFFGFEVCQWLQTWKLRWIQHTPNCQTKQIDIFKEVTLKETSKLLVSGSLFSGAVGGLAGWWAASPHQPNKHSGSALCTFRLRMLAFFVVLGEMIEFHYSNTSSKGLKPTKYNSRSSTLHRSLRACCIAGTNQHANRAEYLRLI